MGSKRIAVAFLPQLAPGETLADSQVIVTDILRATTTIITALSQGAARVVPAASIGEAHAAKAHWGEQAIMGGERGGVIIPGFDRGNSPLEFTAERVAGRTVILCTTNGTVALAHCRTARRVWIGAFVNLDRVAAATADAAHRTVVCSGTHQKITSEDVLFAGALVDRWLQAESQLELDDQAQLAWAYWRHVSQQLSPSYTLAQELARGAGGRNLLKLNYHADIEFCSQINAVPQLPVFDPSTGEIGLNPSAVTVDTVAE